MPKTPAPAPDVAVTALSAAVPDHPHSVLYTCSQNSQTAARMLVSLRNCADACGWPVVHEVYDLAPPSVPRRRRIGWCAVEQLVLRGEVNVLIAPAEREIARTPAERIALRAWLCGAAACALYPPDGLRRTDCAPMRPEGAPA
ncbi:hypothetical protein [Streptomyces sp. NPDC055189]